MDKESVIIQGHEIAGRMPLYKPELRQANRDRIKTTTRRLIKQQPAGLVTKCFHVEGQTWAMYVTEEQMARTLIFKSRYKVGDIRVMCEPLQRIDGGMDNEYYAVYADDGQRIVVASGDGPDSLWWRWKRDYLTSVHMPYEAARSLFRITELRAERLQDIRNDVILNEGVRIPTKNGEPLLDISSKYAACNYINERTKAAFRAGRGYDAIGQDLLTAYFASLWDSINAKPKRTHRNPYTGNAEECYVSYPWKDIREIRKRSGLKWYVIGNPYNWVIGYEAVD